MIPVQRDPSDGDHSKSTATSEPAYIEGSDGDATDSHYNTAYDTAYDTEALSPHKNTGAVEVEDLSEKPSTSETPQQDTRKETPKDSPAYVAPIGKIPKITPIERLSSPRGESSPERRPVPERVKKQLVGKRIDEFGDIVDEKGHVFGRVAGDLPSMVGRTVSNEQGDVLDDDGELVGYVAEVPTEEQSSQKTRSTRSLSEFVGAKAPGGLSVDPEGNILDAEGNVVGSFHDNISGFGRRASDRNNKKPPDAPEPTPSGSGEQQATTGSSDQKTERGENAQSHRRENVDDSPSDIFLDVKSTTEGIQLTIRIPTVFPQSRQAGPPKIVFS